MIQPDVCLHFLRSGRIARVKDGATDWGWGIVVEYRRDNAKANGTLHGSQDSYTILMLLRCSSVSGPGEPLSLANHVIVWPLMGLCQWAAVSYRMLHGSQDSYTLLMSLRCSLVSSPGDTPSLAVLMSRWRSAVLMETGLISCVKYFVLSVPVVQVQWQAENTAFQALLGWAVWCLH